jgi:MOSC domain-containing protein YiiM
VKRFLQSGRSGFYFAVLKEGDVTAGDSIELLKRNDGGITGADVVNLGEMLRIRNFYVASVTYPRFQKAGETTFVSLFGIRIIEGARY